MRSGTPLIRAPKFKPKRDRMIDTLAVECPTCGALPRVHCARLDGQPSTNYVKHPARRRMAVRADNLARGL